MPSQRPGMGYVPGSVPPMREAVRNGGPVRVLVCGGRDFTDADLLSRTLDALHQERHFTVIIEGCARGADQLAGLWADAQGIEHVKFPADWEGLGGAGVERVIRLSPSSTCS
jgi:hypothetical protein